MCYGRGKYKMKYGLLTIHATQNYGSLLQTYSTYKAIQQLGKNVELIDYRNEAIEKRELPITYRPINSIKDFLKIVIWGTDQKKKYDGAFDFLNKYVTMSQPYHKFDIKSANNEYDAFIVGSDLVWGLGITGNDYTYFLDFVENTKKRISFSSSAGTKWSENEKQRIKALLGNFDYISVREQLTSNWIKDLIGKNVPVTCDPTMLWPSTFWSKFVINNYAPRERYVLIYAVNPDKKNISDGINYAKRHGLKAYFINFYSPVRGTRTVRPVTVQQWISLFANADIVFSASYHGLLFSLYFQKPVFFYNRGEKSRMISLSKELGIEYREGIGENVKVDRPICFDRINDIMQRKREYSWEYLKEAL